MAKGRERNKRINISICNILLVFILRFYDFCICKQERGRFVTNKKKRNIEIRRATTLCYETLIKHLIRTKEYEIINK